MRDPVGGQKLVGHRLLDDLLAGRHARELGLVRAAVHRKGPVGRDPRFPGQGVGPIEKLAEVGRLELAQAHQHPPRRPEPQVGPADRPVIALEQYPARLDNLRLVAEVLQLPCDHRLQAHRRCGNQFHFRHAMPSRLEGCSRSSVSGLHGRASGAWGLLLCQPIRYRRVLTQRKPTKPCMSLAKQTSVISGVS